MIVVFSRDDLELAELLVTHARSRLVQLDTDRRIRADPEQVFESGYPTAPASGWQSWNRSPTHGWDGRVTECDGGGARFEITGVEFV